MRRDMDLVRKILLQVELTTEEEGRSRYLAVDGYDQATVARHVELLLEAGLVDAHLIGGDGVPPQAARVFRLKWEGHDFLNAVRNDTVWAKTKQMVKDKGGSASFEIIKAIAIGFAKEAFGLPG
jgi:DNA-binding transcriptional ArsR family regulator